MKKPPSHSEPVTELRRVKIVECGEPLVDFLQECTTLKLDRPRFNYRRETMLRKTVLEKLCTANDLLLSKGYHVRVIEGWRPPFIQRRMYRWSWNRFATLHPEWNDHQLTRMTNRFTAPMNDRVPPPHTTGGAIDIALYQDEAVMDMMGPYDQRDHKGFGSLAPLLGDEARRNRDILAEAMLAVGITNYPSEYWHWSYGDQGWAYRGHHPNALYGPVTPPNWEPSSDDDTDEMLVFQEG